MLRLIALIATALVVATLAGKVAGKRGNKKPRQYLRTSINP